MTATERWLALDNRPESLAEVKRMVSLGQTSQLQGLMEQRLEFGTAGLRALMGPGFSRMNSVTVQQTAQGLYAYLREVGPDSVARQGIVVGEGRLGSGTKVEVIV